MDQTLPVAAKGQTRKLPSAPHAGVLDEVAALSGSGQNDAISLVAESEPDGVLCFGHFRLFTTQRLLLSGGRAVRIGGRALDILIALIKRPGQLVTNCELRELVWPNTFVVEANLTVNIATLRRALGDGQGGNRYIVNVPGRGYYFVAPVTREDAATSRAPQHPSVALQQFLSASLKGLGDRAADVGNTAILPPTYRILDIVESGDGTKTVVIVAVADEPTPAYAYGRTN